MYAPITWYTRRRRRSDPFRRPDPFIWRTRKIFVLYLMEKYLLKIFDEKILMKKYLRRSAAGEKFLKFIIFEFSRNFVIF